MQPQPQPQPQRCLPQQHPTPPHPQQQKEATIRKRTHVRSLRRRDGLLQFAHNITSQNGEDGILEYLFQRIENNFNTKSNSNAIFHERQPIRYLVDVGAWDGKHLSNTYSLLNTNIDDKGDLSCNHNNHHNKTNSHRPWKGILIEAHGDRFRDLAHLHAPNGHVCVHRCVSSIQLSRDSLHSLLCEYGPHIDLPHDFDFLCIDVDGGDYHLWRSLLEYPISCSGSSSLSSTRIMWRPHVVCIEFNPSMPNDLIYIPPQDDSIRHGASLAALVELGARFDYVLVETTVFNAFFVTRCIYEQHGLVELVPDISIEALHEVTMSTTLYQLYDGTIKLHGCKKLLWHRLPIDETRIQVLPECERQFPFFDSSSSSHHPSQQNNIETANATFDDSSVVNVSAWCNREIGDSIDDEKSTCSNQLIDQLLRDGFVHIRGTGIDAQLCRDALEMTRRFLHETREDLRRACRSTVDRARRGYSPACTENFATLMGNVSPNDLVKKFRIGPPPSALSSSSSSSASSSLLTPNIWPAVDTWEDASRFRTTMEAFFDALNGAAQRIVHAVCHGLVERNPHLTEALQPLLLLANDNHFPSTSTTAHASSTTPLHNRDPHHHVEVIPKETGASTTSILTLLGYNVGSRHKGKLHSKGPLVAAHTDVGVLTFLLFDDGNCARLQRSVVVGSGIGSGDGDKEEEWLPVDLPERVPSDPIFVVNVADCLSELSAGYVPSTVHRVIAHRHSGGTGTPTPTPLTPRSACALFMGLRPDQQLCFSGGFGDGNSAEGKKDCITYEEWRRRRIERAQQVRKEGGET